MGSLAVSVIIPTYNRAHLVNRAIHSALVALSPGDEVIVVDDGSTDDTAAIVEGFGPPVRLVKLAHEGAGATRNAGLAAARGPLIALLDSDDEWFPDKIALQRAFLEQRPDVLYAFSDFGVRFEDGTERHRYLSRWMSPPRPLSSLIGPGAAYSSTAPLPPDREDFQVYVGSFYLELMHHNIVPTFTLMARKEVAAKALHFADDLATGEDWQAYARLAGCGPGALFDTETAWQHGHSGPRLTKLPAYAMADAWLSTLERVWGQDREFLAEHEPEYRRTISDARAKRALSLARHGNVREAGRTLRKVGGGPTAVRALWRGTMAALHLW
jgi:glycosyltransferase involved in cell wall biosynthesis